MKVVGVGKRLGDVIQSFWVIRHIAPEHRGDRSIEALDLAVSLGAVRRGEVHHDTQNTTCVLVDLRGVLRSIIGADLLRRADLEHPGRYEGLRNVENCGTLQRDDFRELGKPVAHDEQKTVPSVCARK